MHFNPKAKPKGRGEGAQVSPARSYQVVSQALCASMNFISTTPLQLNIATSITFLLQSYGSLFLRLIELFVVVLYGFFCTSAFCVLARPHFTSAKIFATMGYGVLRRASIVIFIFTGLR